ncbi:MAG: FHA domain-containing protein [Planctomycetota bacterium]
MKTYLRIHDFSSQYGGLSLEEFLARFVNPFLVISIVETKKKSHDEPTIDGEIVNKPTTRKYHEHDPNLVFTYVAYIEKIEEGDPGVISLGRATSNDIVVYHPSVSRRHAVLHADLPSQTFRMADLGSSYGTEVDGKRLGRDEKAALTDGANLVLGKSAHCTFLTAHSFHRYLQEMKQG